MTTRMTINGVSTCQTAGTESTKSTKRLSDGKEQPFSSMTTDTRTENFSLA